MLCLPTCLQMYFFGNKEHHTNTTKYTKATQRREKTHNDVQRRGNVHKNAQRCSKYSTHNIGTNEIQLQHWQQFAKFVLAHVIIGTYCMVLLLSSKVLKINMQKYISGDSAELGEFNGCHEKPI